ncbi:MAG: hypothetical protein ACLFVW_03880 [Phycisphaerae bacterium]
MPQTRGGILGDIVALPARRPGWMLLAASDRRLAGESPRRFRWAWVELMLLSAGWGVGSALLWELCVNVFGWYSADFPFIPTAVVLAVMVLWVYRRAVRSLAELLGAGDQAGTSAAAAMTVVTMALILLGLRSWQPDWPVHMHPWLQWLRPRTMYRALILAPVWGAWAMLITPQFRRPDAGSEPQVAAFARGCGPFAAAVCMAAPLAGSVIYFNHMPWTQLGISATAVLTAVAGGQILCAVGGGLKRRNLLSVNLLTQITFLLAYLANR